MFLGGWRSWKSGRLDVSRSGCAAEQLGNIMRADSRASASAAVRGRERRGYEECRFTWQALPNKTRRLGSRVSYQMRFAASFLLDIEHGRANFHGAERDHAVSVSSQGLLEGRRAFLSLDVG